MPPSYHGKSTPDYMVFHEFGADIDDLLSVNVCLADSRNQNYVFMTGKEPKTISTSKKTALRLAQRAVF
jgi:phosphoketolase